MESTGPEDRPRPATYVAVIGPGTEAAPQEREMARQVGRLLAERGAIVVCGGLDGVMAGVCEGAFERGGLTIGLLPGSDRVIDKPNPHLTVAVPTGMGELRNGLVVRTSDAVIAVGGSWGTLSEVALAMRMDKPIVVIGGWIIEDPLHGRPARLPVSALSAAEAVDQALRLARSGPAHEVP